MKLLRRWIISGLLAIPIPVCAVAIVLWGTRFFSPYCVKSDAIAITLKAAACCIPEIIVEIVTRQFLMRILATGSLTIAMLSAWNRNGYYEDIYVSIYFATIIALIFFVLYQVAAFLIKSIQPKVIPMGFCQTCGYDLRATPDRCPECGTVPPKDEIVST